MAVDPQAFLSAIQGVKAQGGEPVEGPTAEEQLNERLSVGQIFLSRQEVFSSELIDAAFKEPGGRDLSGPAALRNLETAISLVNWLTTDDVLRNCWSIEKDLPELLQQVPEIRFDDTRDLRGVWAQLDADYPEPKTAEEARRQYSEMSKPRMLTGFPANSYLDPTTQAALRIWLITRMARDFTAAETDLRAEWWKVAHRQKNMSRADFERWFALDLQGIAGYRRGLVHGMGGNFFKDLGRSISRLFKDPATWFRNVGKEIGRGLKAVETPFQWMRDKIPFAGYALGGIMPTVIGELGAALEDGSISTFNEQRLVFVTGMNLTAAGTILAAIGTVVGLFFPPLGAILAGIGAIMVAVGQAILKIQQMVRADRLAKLNRGALITPAAPGSGSGNGTDTSAVASRKGGGAAGVLILLGAAALALKGRG